MNCEDKEILKEIFNNLLKLNIKEIKYDKNIELPNISEYEFELVKIKAVMKTNEEVEMYLKMIKNKRIKESIFCYWCTIYEEELMKAKELDNMDVIINKVAISELKKSRYQESIFLTIENNIIKKLKIIGGCPGNTVGVSKLVEGRNIDEVIKMLKGIPCGIKGTSCPDQVARALEEYKKEMH